MTTNKISLSSIVKGKQPKPIRELLYGMDGVGKTHYACSADGVIALDFEGGLSEHDVQSIPLYDKSISFDDVTDALRLIYSEYKKLGCKTVVIDSADWLEKKVHEKVCTVNNVDSIEQIGFGKGYAMAVNYWHGFLSGLDSLRALGLDIIIIAHSQIVRIEDPTSDSYDRHDIKLDKRVRGVVREWSDFVCMCQFETHSFKAGEKFGQNIYKATSTGNRIKHTIGQPAFEAKSRVAIPSPLPLDWKVFKQEIAKARKG